MAQKVEVQLVDDLDGGPAHDTITFALDGTGYEIDLSEDNAGDLRERLSRYVDAGRKVGKMPKTTKAQKEPRAAYGSFTKAAPVAPVTPPAGRANVLLSPGQLLSGKERNNAIRVWAAENGIKIAPRGRIGQEIQDRFDREYTG